MYKKKRPTISAIRINKSYIGETIEEKVRRILNNREPITDGTQMIFSDRKDGVLAGTDIRTDRFDVAIDATDAISRYNIAKREGKATIGEQAKAGMAKEDGKPESTQGTDPVK